MCRPSMSSQNIVIVISSVSCPCVMSLSQVGLGSHPGPLEDASVQATPLPLEHKAQKPQELCARLQLSLPFSSGYDGSLCQPRYQGQSSPSSTKYSSLLSCSVELVHSSL